MDQDRNHHRTLAAHHRATLNVQKATLPKGPLPFFFLDRKTEFEFSGETAFSKPETEKENNKQNSVSQMRITYEPS